MDLIRRLREWALARPRVLVVDTPGTRALRWTVEAELDRRGWAHALSPADADVLLVLGTPGPELAAAVDLLWAQISRPRHRVDLLGEGDVEERLAAAPRELATATEQADETVGGAASVQARSDRGAPMDHSEHQATGALTGADHSGHGAMADVDDSGHGGMEHSGHEAMAGVHHSGHGAMADVDDSGDGGMGHSGHGGMGHSGHEGMDHSAMAGDEAGHHMHHGGEVAGLPMAETAPDRDGLALDVLRVSFGPVLPGWPTGLVLRADLQGDVLIGAELSWLDAGDHADVDPGADPRRTALDHLASLLSVAGWPTAARDARRARDGLASLESAERAAAERRVERVVRQVRRSRGLAWSLRGIGRLDGPDGSADSDVLDRMRRWCDAASADAAASAPSGLPPDDVARTLHGSEVAAARLIVASVEIQRSVAPTEAEVVGA